jgi:hypothetical protein
LKEAPEKLSAVQGIDRVVCEIDAVGENAQNEVVESARQIRTFAAHTLEMVGVSKSDRALPKSPAKPERVCICPVIGVFGLPASHAVSEKGFEPSSSSRPGIETAWFIYASLTLLFFPHDDTPAAASQDEGRTPNRQGRRPR